MFIFYRMVRDFQAVGNVVQIKKLLKILSHDFAMSLNPNSRKGGLIGMAAMAIALGRDCSQYLEELIRPMLSCFADQDSRVRYYACEALYNVIKVGRGDVLPFFNEIFDSLARLTADPDQSVKNGAELLDRLMKDIVTESPAFDLVAFMPLLREKIYGRNQFSKQFIVSWVSLLDSVPDIDMIVFLPEILDGLFKILSDPTPEIRRMCEITLSEFLTKIIHNPSKADFASMINILTIHSQNTEDDLVQFTAITWLKEFVSLAGSTNVLQFSAGILSAILPCLAQDSFNTDDTEEGRRKNVTNNNTREVAKSLNISLMHLLTHDEQRDEINSTTPDERDTTAENIRTNGPQNVIDLASVVEVLANELKKGPSVSTQTKLAVLRWIFHLQDKLVNKMTPHLENEFFPLLLQTLCDPSDEVVLVTLEGLAQIFNSSIPTNSEMGNLSPTFFSKFMYSLLQLFGQNDNLLEERGAFIIRQLCLLINPEDIYRSFSEILLNYEDLCFAYTIVQTLNTILLTSSELFELRAQLRDLKTDESCAFFCCLYRTWCHSPIATLSLCLLTKNYKHACDLLMIFGDLDLTVDFLCEIDHLVQLIESPIFACKQTNFLTTYTKKCKISI